MIVWFDELAEDDRARVGGKVASLGELIAAGLPVPPGFAVDTSAYETLRAGEDLTTRIAEALARVDFDDPAGLQDISGEIRGLIESRPVGHSVADAIKSSYQQLCERIGVEDLPVAVRSSATAEDLPDASFAGQQDTFLWVRGADRVVDAVRRCWSSIFTDRAMAYRRETGHDHERISMAVGVQKMIEPVSAGVAFTLNPTDGDRSQVAIDSSWGFGEAVVSGEVTPDNFLVDKVVFEIVSRTISPKTTEYALVDGTVSVMDVEPARANSPSLTDEQIRAVAAMAKKAERHYGAPQDVEWAIDKHLERRSDVVLLQSRPETVWSRKKPRTVTSGKDAMTDIVSTLISPLHDRSPQPVEGDAM